MTAFDKYVREVEKIIHDHSTNYWLRKVVYELDQRDVMDSINDLNVLQNLMQLKWEALKENLAHQRRGKG